MLEMYQVTVAYAAVQLRFSAHARTEAVEISYWFVIDGGRRVWFVSTHICIAITSCTVPSIPPQ